MKTTIASCSTSPRVSWRRGTRRANRSVVDLAKDYLREKYDKPGNVYVGLIHRLDRPVSGVILLAKTSKAAARLSAQFQEHSVEKVYLAIVEGTPAEPSGEWSDLLVKDPRTNTVTVATRDDGGAHAVVAYRVLQESRSGEPHRAEAHDGARSPVAGSARHARAADRGGPEIWGEEASQGGRRRLEDRAPRP